MIDFNEFRDGAIALSAVGFAAGMLLYQVRRGKAAARDAEISRAAQALDVALRENDALTQRINGLEKRSLDLERRIDEKTKIEEHLMAQVTQLTAENKELRNLIMLNTIPQPLQEFVNSVGERNFQAIDALGKKIDGALAAIGGRRKSDEK